MIDSSPAPLDGPLSTAEVQRLDATLLPALERHQLRLLAHGLRSLQDAADRRQGALPEAEQLELWLQRQPQLQVDPDFLTPFRQQLLALGRQLERIAADQGCAPLGLELSDLIRWSEEQARQRIAATPDTGPR